MPLVMIPIALASCSSSPTSGDSFNAQRSEQSKTQAPASDEDIFLYRAIGASFLCNARQADIEFPKALGIAAATYAQVLNGKHGSFVASAGKEKLTNKQLFAGAEFQIITGALQYCPKRVPEDVKSKVEEAISKQKSLSN